MLIGLTLLVIIAYLWNRKCKLVVSSDESIFILHQSSNVCRDTRPKGERLNPKYICPTAKHEHGGYKITQSSCKYRM